MKKNIIIITIILFLLINNNISYSQSNEENSYIVYEYSDFIKPSNKSEDKYLFSIYITFDYQENKYQIVSYLYYGDNIGSCHISFGNFDQNKSNIKFIDKNNLLVSTCTINNDSLVFNTGIKILKEKKFIKCTTCSKKSYPNEQFNKFDYWKKYKSIENEKKENNKTRIKNGIYTNKDRLMFIKIVSKIYQIYFLDRDGFKYDISSGTWEIKQGKVLFKDADDANVIEAYIIDDTIYPIKQLPIMRDNPPLKLQKK